MNKENVKLKIFRGFHYQILLLLLCIACTILLCLCYTMIDNKEHYITRNITSHDVTLVTAYFNLGIFQKGPGATNIFTPDMYRKWMQIFKKVKFQYILPVVLFVYLLLPFFGAKYIG